jgi:hypothetical protein
MRTRRSPVLAAQRKIKARAQPAARGAGTAIPTARARGTRGRGDANKREELLEAAKQIGRPGKGILIRVV